MGTSCNELKRIAREKLTGHYRIPMGAFLLAGVITFAIELPFSMLLQGEYATPFQNALYYIVDFLISLVGVVLSAGVLDIHLRLSRNEEVKVSYMFGPIKNRPDRYLIAGFLTVLISIVTCIPLGIAVANLYFHQTLENGLIAIACGGISVILAVYVTLKLSQTYFIMLEDETISPWQAICLSATMMKGNMLRLVVIYLSLIGYIFLSILSLGIGLLWVIPYQTQILTQFYLDIRKEVPKGTF